MGVTEAVVGGLGLAGLASGVMGANAAGEAGKNAGRATNAIRANQPLAEKLNSLLISYGDRGLEFAQNQLSSWENMFGGLESNISNYYNSLDPIKFATQYKVDYATQLNKQVQQVTDTLAQRGLLTSGQRAALARETAFNTATSNAQIDLQAPELVNKMKTDFYKSVAQPEKSMAIAGVTGAMDTQTKYATMGSEALMNVNKDIANAYTGQAATATNNAAGWSNLSGNLIGGALSLGLSNALAPTVNAPASGVPSLGFGGNFTPLG